MFLLRDAGALPEAEKEAVYLFVYQLALIIPLVSIFGVVFASWLQFREMKRFLARGHSRQEAGYCLVFIQNRHQLTGGFWVED